MVGPPIRGGRVTFDYPSAAAVAASKSARFGIVVSSLAAIVVVAFGLFLTGLATMVFARPAVVERFLMSFASSARAHYVEQAFRFLIGASLVVLSPAMWQPYVFRFIGWIIAGTAVVLMLLPWRWHHRFGERVLPIVVRRLRVYAVGMLAFGVFLLYGVFFAGVNSAG